VKAAEARIHLDEVLEPMIIPGIFDLVVIADRSGAVLHQQGEAALKVAHLDALLGHGREEGPRRDQESWTRRIAQEGSDAGRLLLRAVQGEGGGTLAGAAGDPGAATGIVEAKIADEDYSVFLQPVILAIEPEEGQSAPGPERWVAVGVISSERLLSAGVVTSPILLFLLVSILPLGLIAWPFLKLALISRRQPFTRLDCAFLVLATVLALSFGALLLVDGLVVIRVQAAVDRQLADLSRVIDRNFRMELLDAWRQLGTLNQAVELTEDGIANVPSYFDRDGDRSTRADGERGTAGEGEQETAARSESGGGESTRRSARSFIEHEVSKFFSAEGDPQIYPYFDSVFWPDTEGRVEKASVPLRGYAVLPQNVADREYVRCALEWRDRITLELTDSLGKRASRDTLMDEYKVRRCGGGGDGTGDETEGGNHREEDGCPDLNAIESEQASVELCLDSLLDRTTGEPIAALSVRTPDHLRRSSSEENGTRADDDSSAEPEEELARPTAALITQLTSLHHPVLPPEVQFAVVEPSGAVLFHSDSRRALTENFLEASDENRLLRALLQNRREGDLTLHYWGRRHRAYLRPIPGLPWSLVVFRGIEDLRLRNFELIYDFLNPFVLHLVVLALLAAAFRWIAPRRFRAYLWPSTQNLPAYRRIVWWTLGVSLLFVVLLAADGLPPGWLFLASFLVAPLTVLYVVWFLPAIHRTLKEERSSVGWLVQLWDWCKKRAPTVQTLRRAALEGKWSPHRWPTQIRKGFRVGLDRFQALHRGRKRKPQAQGGEEPAGKEKAREATAAQKSEDVRDGKSAPDGQREECRTEGKTPEPRDLSQELWRRKRLRWFFVLPGA
ncbi:MAG: hypothetical protein ACOC5J_03880, partial [Gemmatimonadota bacterium]